MVRNVIDLFAVDPDLATVPEALQVLVAFHRASSGIALLAGFASELCHRDLRVSC